MYTLTYDYYKQNYGGILLDEDTFTPIMTKAVILVDNIVFNRLSTLDKSKICEFLLTRINFCICEVCDKISKYTQDGAITDGVKSSETVGNWSVSFSTDSLPSSVLSSIKKTVDSYLGGSYLTCAWC